MASRKHISETHKGSLVAIGGAEDKTGQRHVLAHYLRLCGGKKARIGVIPSASTLPNELGARYLTLFQELGAASVTLIDIEERGQANDPGCVALLDDMTGIFISGGDQVKLLALLGGTAFARKLIARYHEGMNAAGTSAGAAALSQHMIAFGRSGSVPSQRMVQLAPGLAFTDKVIIDQHFRQRDRIGRLMTALAYNPTPIGIGMDEDTAAIIGPDDVMTVIGSGSVTVVDGIGLEYTNIHTVPRHGAITVVGMKVHILTAGCRYSLETREARPAPPVVDPQHAES